ncbi:hypothetical protein [Microbacterium sp. zg-YB36]|uniref:hypothetical protein n=1 Tax=Microbacterium sp. zg-YB36 TaxID=2969407 RepID=UPI00214CD37E|nr:hypothetical protein [Microbacterium sp. zg-YB36]MDL5351156.1 hypothetical protein [Microbacterium sp. zg-YB36]
MYHNLTGGWGECGDMRRAAHRARMEAKRQEKAERIAAETYQRYVPQFGDPTPEEIRAALAAAALAGMEAAA